MAAGKFVPLPGMLAVLLSAFLSAAPAHAAGIDGTIDDCGCESSCYSGSVTGVSCSGDTITFHSNGLPDLGDTLMTGITATNQQFPRAHDYEFTIIRSPEKASMPYYPEPGAVGVAVNGIPIFDPATQGPVDPLTGKRPDTYAAGELDVCGGHAGRGDDYHYHMAPRCLIEDMGAEKVETAKQPIGFAMDGYPILALGWFDAANDIETRLDDCRGTTDAAGNYFYNVAHTPNYAVLNCLAGTFDSRRFSRDSWRARTDFTGAEITGIPVAFDISEFEVRTDGGDTCYVMTGTLSNTPVLNTDQSVTDLDGQSGALFYCNAHCYGQFLQADDTGTPGRVLYFESPRTACPPILSLSSLKTFAPYEGPAQTRKGPQSTSASGQ